MGISVHPVKLGEKNVKVVGTRAKPDKYNGKKQKKRKRADRSARITPTKGRTRTKDEKKGKEKKIFVLTMRYTHSRVRAMWWLEKKSG